MLKAFANLQLQLVINQKFGKDISLVFTIVNRGSYFPYFLWSL